MDTTTIDEAKELLYGCPVDSFVAERDVLVKAIRAGGDRELANATKALRKPSAVAALVNEVVRADPGGVDLILQAAGLLRSAQEGALEGTGINATELQEQYRAAVGALAQTATDRRAEVRAALEAATIDEASNEDLRAGCLVVVPTPVSIFDSGAPVPSPASGSKNKAKTKTAAVVVEPEQPVDELEERREKRRVEKAAKTEAAAQVASQQAAAAEAAAAKEAAAAEKKAAAEAERQRKAVEKARQKEHKELQKRHRDALRAHLTAVDEAEAASEVADEATQQIHDADVEIASAEQALADLLEQRDATIATRDLSEQAKADAQLRVEHAQADVDALAELLEAFET